MAKIKVAVTGGIGSGKSEVMKIIASLGYYTCDCDKTAAAVLKKQSVLRDIKKIMPSAVTGKIILDYDRKAAAKIVFDNIEKRLELEQLTHPIIMENVINNLNKSDGEIAFAEVPLLFEGGYETLFDYVIIVLRDKTLRVESVIKRSGLDQKEIEKRIENQFNYDFAEESVKTAHTLVYNGGDLTALAEKVKGAIDEIKNSFKGCQRYS